MTPNPVGPMPPNVKRWPGGPPYGRLDLDLVAVGQGRLEGPLHDRNSGELFEIKRDVDCGAGCRCAAEATWVPGHNLNGEIGDWVKMVNFAPSELIDDNETVPPGTLGKVVFVDGVGQRAMRWQNGSSIATIPGKDTVEVVLPAKQCKVCGLRCAAYDPENPESYVHDEDQEFADHTAEV